MTIKLTFTRPFYLALSKSNFCLLTSLKLPKLCLNFSSLSSTRLWIQPSIAKQNQQTMSIKSWITNIFGLFKHKIEYARQSTQQSYLYPCLIHFMGRAIPVAFWHILCPVVIWQRHCPDEEWPTWERGQVDRQAWRIRKELHDQFNFLLPETEISVYSSLPFGQPTLIKLVDWVNSLGNHFPNWDSRLLAVTKQSSLNFMWEAIGHEQQRQSLAGAGWGSRWGVRKWGVEEDVPWCPQLTGLGCKAHMDYAKNWQQTKYGLEGYSLPTPN